MNYAQQKSKNTFSLDLRPKVIELETIISTILMIPVDFCLFPLTIFSLKNILRFSENSSIICSTNDRKSKRNCARTDLKLEKLEISFTLSLQESL